MEEAQPESGEDYNAVFYNDHRELIEAFKRHNPDEAVKVITKHCRLFFMKVCHYMEPKLIKGDSHLPDYLLKE